MRFPNVYLASKSPRRRALLKAADIPFSLVDVDVEETFPGDMPLEAVAEYLAEKKANAAIEKIGDGVVLTADSVVLVDDVLLEKPTDQEDARRMLRTLSGRAHSVITGCCLKSKDRTISFSDRTIVHMAFLDDDEIDYYIAHYAPYDKAGSYAIQEWIGLNKVKRIEGSYPNVMGLPVYLVYEKLRAFETQ